MTTFQNDVEKWTSSVEEKVLISIKTLASESFQNCSKHFLGVSQPTVGKTLQDFVTEFMTKKI